MFENHPKFINIFRTFQKNRRTFKGLFTYLYQSNHANLYEPYFAPSFVVYETPYQRRKQQHK